MENIFKFNLESNLNYDTISFEQIKELLKKLRLNISEEIKCMLFINKNIKADFINNSENKEINQELLEKYTLIFNKLNDLCIEEINYISEVIILLDKKIKENKASDNSDYNRNESIYDKIDLTINNYNKIIDNINKTISSLPFIFNLYLSYNESNEEENKYIRNNIEKEEDIYKTENKELNKKTNTRKIKNEEEKEENIINKREKMLKFSEDVKNFNEKKKPKIKNVNVNDDNKIKSNYENIKDNLRNKIKELENEKNELKNFVFKNCIKENEIKNFNKIKEDNKILNEEISQLKNLFQELNNIYTMQNEKLEKLKNERIILEKENSQLIEYINKIISEEEKNSDCINNKENKIGIILENNFKNNSTNIKRDDNIDINIKPDNFESIEMFKRLNKL